jgi:Uma2 family endonuclease
MLLTSSTIAQPKRFTVDEYHRLAELGFLHEDDHIELIRGELIQMASKGTAHETCITLLIPVLVKLIDGLATLRCQSPIQLSFDGEPEPDFAIVQNRAGNYLDRHPTPENILLVIEIADSSLSYDRDVKLPLYAEANIQDYWIFNLLDRHLEAYSDPYQFATGRFGYLNRRIVTIDSAIALPTFPEQVLRLASIFPNAS